MHQATVLIKVEVYEKLMLKLAEREAAGDMVSISQLINEMIADALGIPKESMYFNKKKKRRPREISEMARYKELSTMKKRAFYEYLAEEERRKKEKLDAEAKGVTIKEPELPAELKAQADALIKAIKEGKYE